MTAKPEMLNLVLPTLRLPAGAVKADQRERDQIGRTAPLILFIAAATVALLPSNTTFVAGAFVASLVVLRTLFLQIFRTGHLRFTWFLGTGLLLGYGLGTFNSALQIGLAGGTVSSAVGRDQEALCTALAVCLAASAFLYFVGAFVEKPIRLSWTALDGAGKSLIWISLAITALSYATGGTGFMGAHNESGKASILGEFTNLVTPVLPSYTFLVFRKAKSQTKSLLVWLLIGVEFLALLPQGRRIMIYSTVIMFLALTIRGIRFKLRSARTVLVILLAATTLYFGNKVFFAMRFQRNQMGHKASLGLGDNIKGAFNLVSKGDDRLGSQLGRNLRDRTLVLIYLSDLLDASWRHQPMFGKALLFNFRMALPSFLDPDKESVIHIGAEEVLVNPEFGIKVADDANSILTTSIADFGFVGCFVYPLVLTLTLSWLLRMGIRFLPLPITIFAFFAALFTVLQTEYAVTAYFVQCRNMLIMAMLFVAVRVVVRNASSRKPVSASSKMNMGRYGGKNSRLPSPVSRLGNEPVKTTIIPG